MTSPGAYRVDSPAFDATGVVQSEGIQVVDLADETARIVSAAPERTARTLARLDTLRLTLMRLKGGARVKQHHTDHELSIQTVSGRVSLHTPHEHFDLPQGHVAVLERGVLHEIQADEESAILLTVCMSRNFAPKPQESDNPPAED
ncbi:MAG TPA: AraC family ligand binding domain-containing protein [Polyangiaceae bacterium]|nr:AraC family ligand binding domain-containing protein [Polyangiaceae bacterium]